jgi:hypothetical protein
MTHIILLAEGYSDSLRKFEEEQHGRTFANGKAKLRVREVKLYTCSINREGREEFLAQVKGLTSSAERRGKQIHHAFKWHRLVKYARMVASIFGLKKVDLDSIKADNLLRKPRPEGGMSYNAHFVLVGEIKDNINKDGSENV